MERYDVVVVGGGNAAFCAAHAAREQGARVLLLEKAPRERAGGNSYFTAGATRTAFDSLATLRPLLPDLTDAQAARIDLPPYPASAYLADLRRLTQGRTDPDLAATLVGDSTDTVFWLARKGIRWELLYRRQSYPVGDRIQFWGDLPLGVLGGGKGLIEQHTALARAAGIEVRYGWAAVALVQDEQGVVTGVRCAVAPDAEPAARGPDAAPGARPVIAAGAVVLACGGFEADPRQRAAYLGPHWDLAKVRGTPYNTGDGLQMALDAGAQPYGHWSGCHSVFWDAGAPPTGDWVLTNQLSKLSYPLGIIVNAEGRRFVDEGADFRNYTYARYGAEVLHQPGAVAYQLFDAKTEPLLRADEYRAPGVTRVEAPTLAGLAAALGLDAAALEQTVRAFNAAVQPGPFNPAVKDAKGTRGLDPPKSNWAQPLDTPPFVAFPVTCGITFTFGGLRIDRQARVLDRAGHPIPGLHAAGELVGGLFYHNYPGGSGLMAGAVFGRRAGTTAARWALRR